MKVMKKFTKDIAIFSLKTERQTHYCYLWEDVTANWQEVTSSLTSIRLVTCPSQDQCQHCPLKVLPTQRSPLVQLCCQPPDVRKPLRQHILADNLQVVHPAQGGQARSGTRSLTRSQTRVLTQDLHSSKQQLRDTKTSFSCPAVRRSHV